MTISEIKDYLREIARAEAMIETCALEVERARAAAGAHSTRLDADRVQGGDTRGMADYVCELIDSERTAAEIAAYAERRRRKILTQLDMVRDPKHQKFLYMHYMAGDDLRTIARTLGYSEGNIRHTHKRAILDFALSNGLMTPEEAQQPGAGRPRLAS